MTDFRFDAGNLALDLLNTRPLSGGKPVDWLRTGEAAARWVVDAGLVRQPPGPWQRERLLADLTVLRDAAARLVEAVTQGTPIVPSAVEVINEVLSARHHVPRIHIGSEAPRLEDVAIDRSATGILAPVAVAAAELLVFADPTRVRQCDDEQCVLWFLDTTRNGSRRWCSMARCGGRAKMARYRNRAGKGRRTVSG